MRVHPRRKLASPASPRRVEAGLKLRRSGAARYFLKVGGVKNKEMRNRILELCNLPKLACCIFVYSIVLGSFFVFGASRASATTASDNFNRADGGLGANWTTVAGTVAPPIKGNKINLEDESAGLHSAYWSAVSFTSDQYAQATFPNTPNGTNFGPGIAVRLADSRGYLLWWGNSQNTMSIWRMDSASTWTQIANSSNDLTISTSDVWKFEAVGSNLVGYQNGTIVVKTTDTTYTGGSPGVWLYYPANQLDDWSGGDASFSATLLSTDNNGVKSYTMISAYNGNGTHVLRVLEPTSTVAGVAHSFLYALPVGPESDYTYGNGLETLRGLGAHNTYNVTIIAPSFSSDPWYADHPTDSNYKYESFMASELQPWVAANLATSGNEQHWLLGFSKSGSGPMGGLLLRHPTLFTLGAFWDSAFNISAYNDYAGSSDVNYGTDANFQNNYRLTAALLETYKTPFLTDNRIWISAATSGIFYTATTDFDALLTTKSIQHTMSLTGTARAHNWDSGWVPEALAALRLDSLPVVTAFSIPTTASSLIVDITTFTASDSVSVTGYKLTETSTAPSAGDSGWAVTASTTYTFSSAGSKTLYAWAKNAAGNVSASASSSVTVTLLTIGGTISGLTGTAVLQNNGGDDFSLSANGSFTFPTAVNDGANYAVTVLTLPTGQTCVATNSSGTVASANVTSVSISCSNVVLNIVLAGGGVCGNCLIPPVAPSGGLKISVNQGSNDVIASTTITLLSGQFTKYLGYGQTDADIKRLQVLLNSDPSTQLAYAGPGSPSKETNFFGSLTKKAVIKFQEKYAMDILSPWNLVKGTGIVGRTTLAKINEIVTKSPGR